MKALLFALTLVMSSLLPGQQTWRVYHGGGPNIHFQDLPPAVAAASPGDTIMVIWGPQIPANFFYDCDVTIDKPLRIFSASPYGVPGISDPLSIPMMGKITITGIATGEQVLISNFTIYRHLSTTAPYPAHGIEAVDCAGGLLLEDIRYFGDGYRNSSMRFVRCDDVTLRGCYLELSGEPVTLIDSRMLITTTWIDWHPLTIFVPTSLRYTQTGPGLWLDNSHATVIASLVEGADRQSSSSSLYAGVGAYLVSGSLDIGPYSLLRGGYAFGSRIWSYSMPSPTAGVVTLDPRALPLIHPGAVPWTVSGDVYSTYHDWLVAGETYHVSVVGPPNGFGLLVVGSIAPSPVTIPGLGAVAMDPQSAVAMGLRPLDNEGWTEWTRVCPVNVPVAWPFVFQAAVLSPAGAISLTVPSPFTVAWPHGYVP